MDQTVRTLLARDNRPAPVTADISMSILSVVHSMNECGAGSVLAFDGPELVGIFTERDVLARVVEPRLDPATVRLGEVMTPAPIAIEASATLRDALLRMRDRRVCHLPVVDGGRPIGVLARRDLLREQARELSDENRQLREYIHGPSSNFPKESVF